MSWQRQHRFEDREEAGHLLATRLQDRPLHHPLVLAIPRGGILTGAALAQDLGAELDVVLARKIRAPSQPERALGAISESGEIYLNDIRSADLMNGYIERECAFQLAEIERRRGLFRDVRPLAEIANRSVIVTDDGIATGSTMIAALKFVRARHPKEIIVAVPVAPPDRLCTIRRHCDDLIVCCAPEGFWAVGQFYENFRQVEDDEVVDTLRRFAHPTTSTSPFR